MKRGMGVRLLSMWRLEAEQQGFESPVVWSMKYGICLGQGYGLCLLYRVSVIPQYTATSILGLGLMLKIQVPV